MRKIKKQNKVEFKVFEILVCSTNAINLLDEQQNKNYYNEFKKRLSTIPSLLFSQFLSTGRVNSLQLLVIS